MLPAWLQGVGPGQFEQTGHQLFHALGVGQEIVEEGAGAGGLHGVEVVAQQLQRALHGCERGFEFMRDMGRETADVVAAFGQGFGHGREAFREPRHLARDRMSDGPHRALLAPPNPLDVQEQGADGPGDGRGHQEAEQDGHCQQGQAGQGHLPADVMKALQDAGRSAGKIDNAQQAIVFMDRERREDPDVRAPADGIDGRPGLVGKTLADDGGIGSVQGLAHFRHMGQGQADFLASGDDRSVWVEQAHPGQGHGLGVAHDPGHGPGRLRKTRIGVGRCGPGLGSGRSQGLGQIDQRKDGPWLDGDRVRSRVLGGAQQVTQGRAHDRRLHDEFLLGLADQLVFEDAEKIDRAQGQDHDREQDQQEHAAQAWKRVGATHGHGASL